MMDKKESMGKPTSNASHEWTFHLKSFKLINKKIKKLRIFIENKLSSLNYQNILHFKWTKSLIVSNA